MKNRERVTGRSRTAAWNVLLCLAVSGCHAEKTEVLAEAVSREATPGAGASSNPAAVVSATPTETLPLFRAIGPEAGLDFRRYDDFRGEWRLLEVNGGGVALFDFDRDGRLDVFYANGCRLPRREDDQTRHSELFRNWPQRPVRSPLPPSDGSGPGAPAREGLFFEKVTGPSALVQFGYCYGCAVGDINSDGFEDLYITAFGQNALWANNGDGTFAEITAETGTQAPLWSSSAAFADMNGDGHLDLYVCNYVVESEESPRLCPRPDSPGGHLSCSPSLFNGAADFLFLSDGAGGFIDATAAAGLSEMHGKGLGIVVADLDRDGRPELFVASDGEANFLLVNTASGTAGKDSDPESPPMVRYENHATIAGVALSESGYAQANMGIAAGDYDANGAIDLFVTHFLNDTNILYANKGGLMFEDVTRSSGVGPPSRQVLGWGTVFIDDDNDGWLDLFATNGHVDDRSWRGTPENRVATGEPWRMRPTMMRNGHRGRLFDVTETSGDYFRKTWLGRGAAAGDINLDGLPDLAVSHQEDSSVVLLNETPSRHQSLTLKFVSSAANRNGYGVRVELIDTEEIVVRELIGGASYLSASAAELHVGLGDRVAASFRVYWPSGAVETYEDMSAGRWILREGERELSLP